jgi:nuclear receptor subfamily 2 group E protein 1
MTLSKYDATAYPSQPFRFGKSLLMLPALRAVSSRTIEEVFFKKTIGSISIERVIVDMYKSQMTC